MALPLLRSTLLLATAALTACNARELPPAPQAQTAPAVQDGSLMVPGRPQLSSLPAEVAPGVQQVGWNMWWGENGREWVLKVNGQRQQSGELKVASPKEQKGRVELHLDQPGRYEIRIALCNDHGCSESEPAVLQVNAG